MKTITELNETTQTLYHFRHLIHCLRIAASCLNKEKSGPVLILEDHFPAEFSANTLERLVIQNTFIQACLTGARAKLLKVALQKQEWTHPK